MAGRMPATHARGETCVKGGDARHKAGPDAYCNGMMRVLLLSFAVLAINSCAAAAQDIRGLEVCTAEKTMERRTACLQSNVEFLHQALDKQARETRVKLDAAGREAAAQKAEIAALKAEIERLRHAVDELKKAKPEKK